MKQGVHIEVPKGLNSSGEIFSLYRVHSKTLGFMPLGGFGDGLSKGTVIIARDDHGKLAGYLLYRIAKGRAAITHLCVASRARGKGVAKALVRDLVNRTAHLDGITLRCRRDFDAHRVWPKLGFVPKGTTQGRGADRAELVIWHIDHGKPNLFSNGPTEKTAVVIDTNVFFDLCDANRSHHVVSAGLVEPWLDETIELLLTPEIYNDIDRCEVPESREKSRSEATRYRETRAAPNEVSDRIDELFELYPASVCLRDESDIRHIAHAITAGIKFFVTRDEAVLELAPEVLQRYGLHLLSPVQLISQLDLIERESEYEPIRLSGCRITQKKASHVDVDALLSAFRAHPTERGSDFRKILATHLATPRTCTTAVTRDENGLQLVLVAWAEHGTEITIPILRVAVHPLAPTLLRNVLMTRIQEATALGRITCLKVTEAKLQASVIAALIELGFVNCEDGWAKPLLKGFFTVQSARAAAHELGLSISVGDSDALESIIWPGKIDSGAEGHFLVPIQAQWAKHFFDSDLASQDLFGAREDLHLGVEGVYYSAAIKTPFKAPGRILWYVSQGPEGLGSMQVKAMSRLREVVRGSAKELFARFRRLGVFEWRHIWEMAKKRHDRELVALRFSHTELFTTPLSESDLAGLGIRPPFPGPRRISVEAFRSCYNHSQR